MPGRGRTKAPSKPCREIHGRPAPPKPRSAASAGLGEGAKAPAFSLPRDGGGNVSLADFKGRKLVLFFYPRADTPGCTKEAIDFSRLSARSPKTRPPCSACRPTR